MNSWEIIILFFSFQALIFGVLFLFKREGFKTAHRIFGIFLLLYSYNLFFNVLYWSRFDTRLYTAISGTYYIVLALYGGLFYFYVKKLTTGQLIKGREFLLFSPLILVFYQFGSYYFLDLDTKMKIHQNIEYESVIRYVPYGHIFLSLFLLGMGIYTYARFIRNYKEDPEMSIWLKAISATFILFGISHVVYAVLVEFLILPVEYDYFITLFMIALIVLVTYFAFNHSSIFNGQSLQKVIPLVKYEKTGLSSEFSMELKDKLMILMESKKPYLNSDVRLDTIADLLDISRHHASQIINEHFSLHFFDFINKYRIREAERLLSSGQALTIEDIAYQSGFNNRISFYKAFKKIMGCTPSTYRRHHLAS